jgi:hypothetical protein
MQPPTQSHCFMLLSQQRELYPFSPSTSLSYSFSSSFPTEWCLYLLSPKLTCVSKWSRCIIMTLMKQWFVVTRWCTRLQVTDNAWRIPNRPKINPLTPELNPSAQRYLTRFFTGVLLLELCISFIYAWKTNKCKHYSFSLLIMYGISYMFRHYVAILRERSWCLLRDAQLRSSR